MMSVKKFNTILLGAYLTLSMCPGIAQVSGGLTSVGTVNPGDLVQFKNKAQVQRVGGTPLNGQCAIYIGTFPTGSWQAGSCSGGASGPASIQVQVGTGLTVSPSTACATGTCDYLVNRDPTAQIISYNGRFGAVVPANGDYSFSQISGSVAASQMPALTGAVTSTAGTTATTLANDIVTNSNLATMAALTVKGAIVAGQPTDLTPAQITANFCVLASSSLPGCIPQLSGNTLDYFGGDGVFHPTNGDTILTGNRTLLPADCNTTVQIGTGLTGLFTFTLPASPTLNGFHEGCKIILRNGDSSREKLISGGPTNVPTIVWPWQSVTVQILNSVWAGVQVPGKWQPTSPTVFNVSTTGTDAPGCALGTGSAACATGTYAMNMTCQYVDLSLLNPSTFPSFTIKFADGAYTQNMLQICDPQPNPYTGASNSGFLKIAGNTNLTGVTLNCGSSACFSGVHSLAGWWIEGFTTSGSNGTLVSDAGSVFYMGTNNMATAGGSAYDVAVAFGSMVEFEASFTSSNGKNLFANAVGAGTRLIFKPITVTFNSASYNILYQANTGGVITAQGASVTYNGTASVGTNGCWQTATAGGLDTGGTQSTLTAVCRGAGNIVTSPGWVQ